MPLLSHAATPADSISNWQPQFGCAEKVAGINRIYVGSESTSCEKHAREPQSIHSLRFLRTPLGDAVGQQPIEFRLDDLVALAGARLETAAIEHADPSPAVADQPKLLQLPRSLGNAFAAHAEHVGDQFLGHGQLVGLQTIEAQ